MMFHMGKAHFVLILEQFMKDSFTMEHAMVLENMYTLIMLFILDILLTTKQMDKESMKVLKGIRMKVNGNLIFLMEKEERGIQMDKLMMAK